MKREPRTDPASSHALDRAMERYAAGDDAAFAVVYDALAPKILSYLARRTRDWQDAEDLLQQTMLHVHRSREAFIPGAEVSPWAFAIARHLLIDRMRRREPGPHVDLRSLELHASPGPGADELVDARELAVRIERALDDLPSSQRRVLTLVKEHGLTFAEAARVLGTSAGAVRARASRAYDTLRFELARARSNVRRGVR